MTLKTRLEYVRICVSQHILYIWPYIVNDKLERVGGAKYILLERYIYLLKRIYLLTFGKVYTYLGTSLGVEKFHQQSHIRSYKKKVAEV